MANTTKYFVQNGAKIEGPYVLHDVLNLPLTHDTLVWKEGMQSWSKASELEEFSSVLAKIPPPLYIDFNKKETIAEENAEAVHHHRSDRYFIYNGNKTTGPYTAEQIREMNLGSDVLLWRDGMKTWEKKSEFKEFETARHTPPPLPANNNDRQAARETVTRKRSGSSLFYIILLLCLLFLFLFFFCRMNSCCCHKYNNGMADTTANQSNIITRPDTSKPAVAAVNTTADSMANATATEHQHYLQEIATQIYNAYMANGGYTPSSIQENNEMSGDTKYATYLNNMPKELKGMYAKALANMQDSAGQPANTDSTNYFNYIDNINSAAAQNFTANIGTLNDSDNQYDKTYLLSIEQVLQKQNTVKTTKHHHHYNADKYASKPVVTNSLNKHANKNIDNLTYYQYPEIFLGHNVKDIFKAYGDKYTSDDDLQNDSYTITYYSPYYERNYIIDKETDSCTKFSIKFYFGTYYDWYLQKMLPSANAIGNTNRSWMSSYENKPIEIDLKTVGNRSAPVLVYYFTEAE